jgi:hypothetical protein
VTARQETAPAPGEPDAYLIDRAGIVRERITAADAHRLYADAKTRPGSNLAGDLETGFTYWAAVFDDVRLVRCHVHPLAADARA